jgi:type IV pilus assembly protein PilP
VAVIEINNGFIAMVEEASGKGYEVKTGTYMGRRGGRVTAIKKDRLVIREYFTDYQGKQRERNQEIKFHKTEGGE